MPNAPRRCPSAPTTSRQPGSRELTASSNPCGRAASRSAARHTSTTPIATAASSSRSSSCGSSDDAIQAPPTPGSVPQRIAFPARLRLYHAALKESGRLPAPSVARRDLREDPERRRPDRHLVDLGVHAAELAASAGVAGLDLRAAHRQRLPLRLHPAEAVPAALSRAQQVDVDLDLEDLLQATHVGVAELAVRVDERARALDAGGRVDDLVAMNLAAPALGLVLRVEREAFRGRRRAGLHSEIVVTVGRAPQDLTSRLFSGMGCRSAL